MDPSQPRPPGELPPATPTLDDPGELELAIFDLLRVAMLWRKDKFASLGPELGENHRDLLRNFLQLVARHRGPDVPVGRDPKAPKNVVRAKDLSTVTMVEVIAACLLRYQAEAGGKSDQAEDLGREPAAAARARASISAACRDHLPSAVAGVERSWEQVSKPRRDEGPEMDQSGWVKRLKGPRPAAVELLGVMTGTSARHAYAVLAAAKADPRFSSLPSARVAQELAWTDTWAPTIRYGLQVLGFTDDVIARVARAYAPAFTPSSAGRSYIGGQLHQYEYQDALDPPDSQVAAWERNETNAESEGADQSLWIEGLRQEAAEAARTYLDWLDQQSVDTPEAPSREPSESTTDVAASEVHGPDQKWPLEKR